MQEPLYPEAKFLIIDDEPANVRVLEHLLDEWGCHNIASTTDPLQALPLFCSIGPDVVLLDLMMPELDGFGVLEQLKAVMDADSYLPVLVLTADLSPQSKRRALAAGARDFLTKPFDAVELSLRLRNLLDVRFLHRQLVNQNHQLEEKVAERTHQLKVAEIETVECLASAAEYRDDDTGQHTQRVGEMAARVAARLGLPEERVELIRGAAPLHDIGKIGIADQILLKPGKLTPEEFEAMKHHCQIGHHILRRHHTPMLQLAAEIALYHHERWDGSGYPSKLVGTEIPLEGRIVAIVDVFDALTHERPYKRAWTQEQAVEEILRVSGSHFDPAVVRVFMEELGLA